MNYTFINNFINSFDTNKIFIFSSCLIFIIGIFLSQKYFKSVFGLCFSNEKTSIKHPPMIRGLGVWYFIALLPIFILHVDTFKISEWFIIFSVTFLGFIDDKVGISQKKKLLFLSILWFLSELINYDNTLNLISHFNVEFFLHFFMFIFFILFFNQIDGINGLASITYLLFVLFLIFIIFVSKLFLNFYIICLFLSLIYLLINLYGKIGIQGESGSFFMGVTSYLLAINSFDSFKVFYSFFLLCPVLLDLIVTSIYLFFRGHNLFRGHRENMYQKLSSKYQSHSLVSFCFALFQILFSIFIIYLWNSELSVEKTTYFFIFTISCVFILYFLRMRRCLW